MRFFVAPAGTVPACSVNARWSVAAFAARFRRLAGLRPKLAVKPASHSLATDFDAEQP
jgi:hypothetical protein